jgi:hypothetical protein
MTPPDDDHDWMRTLAGRKPTAAQIDVETVNEAALLRKAYRQWPDKPVVERLSKADMISFMQRARCEIGITSVTALAGVVVVTNLRQRLEDESAIERSGRISEVLSAQRRQDRDALATTLRAAGVASPSYEHIGRPGIDAELPRPLVVSCGSQQSRSPARRTRWACGQAAFEPVQMSTGRSWRVMS